MVGRCVSMLSVPLWKKQRVRSAHVTFLLLKVIYKWVVVAWKWHKTKRNTFYVTSEPHLLVVIVKAYVSGFYIHITSSGLHIHTRESSKAKWRFTKDNINGRGSSVHIYNIIKMCQDLLNKTRWKWRMGGGGGWTWKMWTIILHHRGK